MSANKPIAQQFELMAAVLELLGANRFRVAAFQRGARVVGDLTVNLADLADDVKKLTALDGIGKGLAEKIIEFVQTGKMVEVDDAVAEIPPGVIGLLQISGLGPKTVATLWKEGGVDSLEDLKAKLETDALVDLPRLGTKSLEKLKKSVAFAETAGDRVRIGAALAVAETFVAAMKKVSHVTKVDYAGSLRRGRETIGDVDILVGCKNPNKDAEAIGAAFRELESVVDVLAAGQTKSSVRTEQGLQVDLRVVDESSYGAALMYFTGSKEHNVEMRERAIERGLRLNEYGLWDGKQFEKTGRDGTPAAAKTEAQIYKKLGLATIPPAMRESRGELQAADAGPLPKLITVDDIRCELHAHTTASDGRLSIEELAETAKARGFHTIAVTDHSPAVGAANGLDPKRLRKHIIAVRKADETVKGIRILAGTEVDILANGKLDYDDKLLSELDLVVASPHVALGQDPKKSTARLLKAIENPYVHIIGHMTGRLIGRREGMSPDLPVLLKAAAETGTALEINSSDWRLDLRDTHARAAIEAGAMLAINTDAHGAEDFDQIRYGILTARRAWVEPKHVVNCMTAAKLATWLSTKRNAMA